MDAAKAKAAYQAAVTARMKAYDKASSNELYNTSEQDARVARAEAKVLATREVYYTLVAVDGAARKYLLLPSEKQQLLRYLRNATSAAYDALPNPSLKAAATEIENAATLRKAEDARLAAEAKERRAAYHAGQLRSGR